jgi:hypothetical protein
MDVVRGFTEQHTLMQGCVESSSRQTTRRESETLREDRRRSARNQSTRNSHMHMVSNQMVHQARTIFYHERSVAVITQ